MTYAPNDLLAVRAYVKSKTGLSDVETGIVGDDAHSNSGYHIGATGVQYFDYSRDEATPLARDNPSPLPSAASAFDLGGRFGRFREITMGIVHACENGDPRTRDIREVIYTPDGSTVRRWDRERIRNTGDSSHLSHTHVSFYRDSEGRRANTDNFLGLLTELFEGPPPPPPAIQRLDEENEMKGMLPVGFAYDENGYLLDPRLTVQVAFEDVNVTLGNIFASFSSDHIGRELHVRFATGSNGGGPVVYQNGKMVIGPGQQRTYQDVTDGHSWAGIGRRKTSANPAPISIVLPGGGTLDVPEAEWPIAWSLERYPKV